MPAPDHDSTASVDAVSPRPVVGSARLVAVLDMGASAIRLAIAEIVGGDPPHIIEEASKGASARALEI
jgi:hypothetical protein